MAMELNVAFGHWHPFLAYLDSKYCNIVTRLIQFAREAGIDRYGRLYDFEDVVDFVIDNDLAEFSVDYIYRQYVYKTVSKEYAIDTHEEEIRYHQQQFISI